MEEGEKAICSKDELYNAFGDRQTVLELGQRVTVIESRNICGHRFYAIKEAPKDNYFDAMAFTPMRALN